MVTIAGSAQAVDAAATVGEDAAEDGGIAPSQELVMTNPEHVAADPQAEIADLRDQVRRLIAEIAEYERTRQLLREEYSFRKAVIERAAEGLCVCHAIADFPFVEFTVWNSRMEAMTGYSMDEINRVGWYQTMYPDPEARERAIERMQQMREGKDLRNEQWEIMRADGQRRIFRISTSVLTTDDGLVHALGLMLDVTDVVAYRQQLESQVERLEGLLPICASCKKIRDEGGQWHRLETYITRHSQAEFSHGICPECTTELYPDVR